jgi:hypothetical protein
MIPRMEDIARRASNERLADAAEREADRLQQEWLRERLARARRGDTSYTQNPKRYEPFR